MASKRLVDLIQKEDNFTFSFEVTPNVIREDIENLEDDPKFYAVTWHAKSHQCDGMGIGPLITAAYLRSMNKQVMMHLSCDMLRKHYLEKVLAFLQEHGIRNLFLVLGDGYDPSSSDFKNTLELLKYIREITGQSYFCIGVAGFCDSTEEKLFQLKEKIKAGAEFIVTQAFFEPELFIKYYEKCRAIGINVPIIPGLLYFENHEHLNMFSYVCNVKVPDDIIEYAKKCESDDVIAGVGVINNLVKTIKSVYPTINFHFFALNKIPSVYNVIKQIEHYFY